MSFTCLKTFGDGAMVDELDPQMSGTADGLMAFLDWASRTGELSPNTAASYRTAVTQVFEIDGEAWGSTLIGELDVDRQLDRFARLRASRYNAASLRTYGNRFKAAIANYTKYLEDPAAFRARGSRGPRTKGPDKPVKNAKQTGRTTGSPETGPAPERVAGPSSGLVQYPFPLRSGVLIYLSLPRDLRRSEAQRIAAFVASLAIDPGPELGAGKSEGS
jgi:hypothetical protein